MTPPDPRSYRKGAWMVGAILLTASVSGYFMGLRQTGSQISMTRPVSLAKADPDRREMLESRTVPVAVAYAKQDWLAEGPNAAWRNHLAHLVQPPVDPAMLTNVTPAERAQALAERAGRRAFDGAPPVVPHPITQDSSAACLACHGPGLAVKDKVASKISHAHYASCTQCHVPAGGPQIPTLDAALLAPLAGNEFTYAAWPRQGGRPWPGAPPAIPHSTLLRSDCLSCHGPRGVSGLRTPHPERQACGQCHVADAERDQHAFLSATQ